MLGPSRPSQVILITGGTGFVGSHLAEYLQDHEPEAELHLTSLSSKTSDSPRVKVHAVDLTDAAATTKLIQNLQPTQVYHLAAWAAVGNSFDQAAEVMHQNGQLQLNILAALKVHAPQARVLTIGSAEEYGIVPAGTDLVDENFPFRPANPYAVSKITQDMLAFTYWQAYRLPIIRVRPFNHTGERQSELFAIPSFAKQIVAIERGQQTEIKVGNLTAIRDFSDVKDVVAAYYLLMNQGEPGEVYNVGSGQGYVMHELLDQLVSLAEKPIKVTIDPSRIRPLDVPRLIADNGKIRKLGWEPHHPFTSTLARVLNYWRHQS
jgi:GDP-4-dehydro-6-deoxy-D-mannose reductase